MPNPTIPHDLLGKIIDEVFDGAIEDASVIEEIYAAIKRYESPPPVPLSMGTWRPIAEADKSADRVIESGNLRITNSEEYWVRDDDGRIYQATWADDGKRAYWWDLEGESPVDPVEFMPHPLDRRFELLGGFPVAAAEVNAVETGDGAGRHHNSPDAERRAPQDVTAGETALLTAAEGIADDYMTSETHHPGWVLIPEAKFNAIRDALEKISSPTQTTNLLWWQVEARNALAAQPAPAEQVASTEDQREAWMDGDTTGAYIGTEASKRLPLKAAPADNVMPPPWRVFEDITYGWWGIEEDIRDGKTILFPKKINRDPLDGIVRAHNAALAAATEMPNSAGSQIPDSAEVRHGARVDDRTLPGGAGSSIDIAKAKQFFTDYFVKNYPGPDTIIFDPKWHAPRLFEVALRCIRAATATSEGGE